MNGPRALAISCRPRQWIKNGLVFVPLISSASFFSVSAVERSAAAAASFTLMSSAVYLLNDLTDREFDRAHPGKEDASDRRGRFLPARNAAVAGLAARGRGVVDRDCVGEPGAASSSRCTRS